MDHQKIIMVAAQLLGTSAEFGVSSTNIFVGQTEAPLIVGTLY